MADTNFTTSTASRSVPFWGSAGFGGDIVWRPTPEVIARTHLTHFMAAHGIASFAALRFA